MFDPRTSGFTSRIRYRRLLKTMESFSHARVLTMVGRKEVRPTIRDVMRWQDIDYFHVGHCNNLNVERSIYNYCWKKLWES